MKLVIVESPAKAKTINKYLGKDFKVVASFGHIRDLPSKSGSVLPEQDFSMKYVISDKAKKYVSEITKAASKAESVYLATDPDREGESISWHVAEVIKEQNHIPDSAFKRIAFNEITQKAVMAAISNPRSIDINLVHAQQARRALDYLVGFTLSPLLWRKLPGCKSAGRVQSVALRLICEREEEIEQFKSQEYWDITFDMLSSRQEAFVAKLTNAYGKKLEKFSITNQQQAEELKKVLEDADFFIDSIEKKQQKRNPSAPFITSSLQQEAARKLGFSAKKTMQIAQKLYEGMDINGDTTGLITYMRTDGVTLASEAIEAIRNLIDNTYGTKYLPNTPRVYKSKVKNAQEAHEAIRPTDINLTPASLKGKLEDDFYKLYDLIWKRTIACQMENVVINIVTAHLESKDKQFGARAHGSSIEFDGFYKIYREGTDDEHEGEDKLLPHLNEGEETKTKAVKPAQHFTEPLPRYTEASLVKKLEELGIGRPSTYASIISVLQERNYVSLVKKRFIPEELGRLVTVFLVGFFKKYVEYDFTAQLETDLDVISEGKLEWKDLLKKFWQGFNDNVSKVSEHKITDVIEYVEKKLERHLFPTDHNGESKICPTCKTGTLHLRLGKYGAFLGCSRYPECTFKKTVVSAETQQETTETPVDNNRILGTDPATGQEIHLKKGPYGWYVELELPKDIELKVSKGKASAKKVIPKPKRIPLPSCISPAGVTINDALNLLKLPLTIGKHPATGEDISINIGKFGPYLKHADKFTSIPKTINPFEVNLNQAVELIAAKEDKKKTKTSKV